MREEKRRRTRDDGMLLTIFVGMVCIDTVYFTIFMLLECAFVTTMSIFYV